MTPKENYTGESIITVSAHDNISLSGDTTTFKLIVNNINDAPVIAEIEDDNADEDSMEKSVMLSASDVDSKDLKFYVSNDTSAVDAFITGKTITFKNSVCLIRSKFLFRTRFSRATHSCHAFI